MEEYLGACWSSCRLKQVCDASKSISAALASSLSFRQMFWVQPLQPSAKLRSACLGWFSSSSRCFFCPYDVIRRLEWSPSPSGLWMLDDLFWFFEMLPVISYQINPNSMTKPMQVHYKPEVFRRLHHLWKNLRFGALEVYAWAWEARVPHVPYGFVCAMLVALECEERLVPRTTWILKYI